MDSGCLRLLGLAIGTIGLVALGLAAALT